MIDGTIAHCVESSPDRPMPFVTDQAVGLAKYKPIIFSFNKGIWKDGWKDVPAYIPYAPEQPKVKYYFNKAIQIASRIPWDFHKAVRAQKVKLLHAHFIPTAIQFLPLKLKYNLPMIVSCYGYDVSRFPRESDENMRHLKKLFETAEYFLAMSEDMKNDMQLLGCPPVKIMVHHIGVDINRFAYRESKTDTEKVVFLYVCDFSPKKGVPILVEAMATVCKAHPEARLRVIGMPKWRGAPIKQQAEKMIRDMGLQNMIDLVGVVNYYNMPKEYADADLFVLSSKTDKEANKEGIPAVILEAMATGLPVISTRHAGIPEVVIDDITGYLVPEDDTSHLARTMIKLLEEKHRWRNMGLAGSRLCQKEFNVEIQKKKLEQIYCKVLATDY